MPRGDRSKRPSTKLVGSIFGAFAALTVIGGIGYGLRAQASYEHEAQQKSADYAKHAAAQVKQSCVRRAGPEKASCIEDAVEEYRLKTRDNRREQEDLVAQRSSALWAEVMGLAALIGMALSGIGVALVYITFAETRLTNRIAMKEGARSTRRALASAEETAKALELAASTAAAAKEANELAKGESWRMIIKSAVDAFNREKELKIAQQSAEAAMKSVAISEDTAKRQLRAYVALRDATIALSQPPDEPAVASLVNVVNSGTTPAFNISAQTGLFIGPDESELPPIPPVERVKLTLGKDTPYTFANRLLPSPEMMAAVREGRLNVYAFGRIEYDDAFGAPHFLEFRMVYDPTRGIGAMIPSLTGNDAD